MRRKRFHGNAADWDGGLAQLPPCAESCVFLYCLAAKQAYAGAGVGSRPAAVLRERLLSGKLLDMIRRVRDCKLALPLLLAVGAYQAAAAPACVSALASANIVVSNAPTSNSKCPQNWASIKPADFKEPIENPFRLGWREWTLLASGIGFVFVLSAAAVRVARRRSETR